MDEIRVRNWLREIRHQVNKLNKQAGNKEIDWTGQMSLRAGDFAEDD